MALFSLMSDVCITGGGGGGEGNGLEQSSQDISKGVVCPAMKRCECSTEYSLVNINIRRPVWKRDLMKFATDVIVWPG